MGRRLPFPYPPPGRRSFDECVPGPDFQQRTRPWRLFQIKWGALPFPRIFSRRKAAPRPMENKPMAATDESLSAHPPPHHDKPAAPRPPYRTAWPSGRSPGCSGVNHRVHAENVHQQLRRYGGIHLAHAAVYRCGGNASYSSLMEAKHRLFRNPADLHVLQKRREFRVAGAQNPPLSSRKYFSFTLLEAKRISNSSSPPRPTKWGGRSSAAGPRSAGGGPRRPGRRNAAWPRTSPPPRSGSRSR